MASNLMLFLCGDIMTGRGIDQILPHPCDHRLHEPYMKSAAGYVELAEKASGAWPRPVSFDYVWGDALDELAMAAPDLRIANLETAVTCSRLWWRDKMIHYRMSPENAPCLAAAGIDACTLANNHVLDWGHAGMGETLKTLREMGIQFAGAGCDLTEAQAPAVLPVAGKGRVLLYAFGSGTSGIPADWAATEENAGVHLLPDLSAGTVHHIGKLVNAVKQEGDVAVASIHWGGNWGYAIPPAHRNFAHALIDNADIDLVHGHSSHHVIGIEVHRGKLILYGCGDFLTDYEGISGHEVFRGDLGLMYFPRLMMPGGQLAGMRMVPTRVQRFRIARAAAAEAAWLEKLLNREGAPLGTGVQRMADHSLELHWRQEPVK
jgi:poly-gamma-glutamate capsule biosynthesis protein CapA/YwtB (metallophosphatase superfamily)